MALTIFQPKDKQAIYYVFNVFIYFYAVRIPLNPVTFTLELPLIRCPPKYQVE